ncbi:MAG TPA: carbohydrate ABC transporter permease, partial [Chloroflexota bacterium]
RMTLGGWLVYGLLVLGAAVALFPFAWMVLGSFKSAGESNLFPPTVLPLEWYPENYLAAWTTPPSTLGRYFLNSMVVSVLGTSLQLVIGVLAAYAFARLRFPGRDALFLLVLATTMVPSEITLIPNFVTIRRFPLAGGNDLFGSGGSGLYDTYPAMVLPFLAGAFNIFLLRQAFMRVPNEYWEAAQLDGAGGLGFLWRILLPLTVPALFTVALFGFLGRWNALLWPLIVTRSESMRPVQVAMIYYQNEFQTNYGLVMAASFMVTLPIIVVFVLAQKHFIAGISSAGLKG